MDQRLLEIFSFLGLEDELNNEKLISLQFVNDKIEVTYSESLDSNRLQIGELTELDIKRIAQLLRSVEGMRKVDDMNELIYSHPFLIQIPTTLNHILINRVAASIIPQNTITRLWEQRIPYFLNREVIVYRENGDLVNEPHEGQKLLKFLKQIYYRMAYDMDSFSSQHSSGLQDIQKHMETIRLPSGDLILIYFDKHGDIMELNHMMK